MLRSLWVGILVIAGLWAISGSFAPSQSNNLTPSYLRCEYLIDPLAIDTKEQG